MWQRRAVRHSRAFLEHIVPAVIKPAHTLWNEVIGFIFICLAVWIGSATIRAYMAFTKASPEEVGKFLVEIVLGVPGTLILLYFGISSFLKARRISRS